MRHIRLAHDASDAVAEKGHCEEKDRGGERRDAPCGGEKPPLGGLHLPARLLGLGRKTEVTGLHTHRQKGERQRDEGIDIRHDAVGLLPENTGVVRREQVAQEPYHDGTDTVDGGLFGQFFEHDECL